MRASDIMTRDVIAVVPSTPVTALAQLLVERRISAVPVVDNARLVGVVSESDLLHRDELGTEATETWWSDLFRSSEHRARAYVKAHGRTAADVMSTDVKTVPPNEHIAVIANILDRYRIRRVLVLEDGQLVGIVSRSDLLRLLVTAPQRDGAPIATTDRELSQAVRGEVDRAGLGATSAVHVIASGGRVGLWGFVESETERHAIALAAADVAGPGAVENHLSLRALHRQGPFASD